MKPAVRDGAPYPAAPGRRQLGALLAAFAAGVLVGVSALVLAVAGLTLGTPSVITSVAPVGTEAMVRRLDRALTLDPRQEAAVRAIVQRERLAGYLLWHRARPELRAMIERANRDIHALLTPPQQVRFRQHVDRRVAFVTAMECRLMADDTSSTTLARCLPRPGGR